MYFKYKITDILKVKEWGKIYHGNCKHEKAYRAILILNRNDLKRGNIFTKNKFGYFIMEKKKDQFIQKQNNLKCTLIIQSEFQNK